jgi:hypothetical protein
MLAQETEWCRALAPAVLRADVALSSGQVGMLEEGEVHPPTAP